MANVDSDSGSESDNESGLGNVNRLVIRPPGHTGKAKKGHLVFDASFEGGNLGKVEYVSEFEYDLYIRPDTCNPRFRLWFNFIVENVRADQRVIFNIVNFSKIKSLYREGMAPLVKSTFRPEWHRIPSKYVFYFRSPEHHGGYVLSFAFAFDREDDVYQFAYSYPYSYSRLRAFLDEISNLELPYVQRETVARSLQERKVDMLTIGNSTMASSQEGSKETKQRIVFVTARLHPGETPPSFVVQGLIIFLISDHPIARVLREFVTFKIVPMVNPDGVFLGNYRSTLLGSDLNRNWGTASPWAHPELHTVRKLLQDLDKDPRSTLDICLDIHAHSSLLGCFIYGNMYDDVYRLERHLLFPKLFSQVAEDFSADNTIYNRDPLKAGTARRYLCGALPNRVNCYTLEVSFHGYANPKGSDFPTLPYTEESYMQIGRNLSRTFLDYYKSTGHISASLPLPLATIGGAETRRSLQPPTTSTTTKEKGKVTRGSFLPGASSALVTDDLLRATGVRAQLRKKSMIP